MAENSAPLSELEDPSKVDQGQAPARLEEDVL